MALGFLVVCPGFAWGAMSLLHREMFSTSGTLTSAAPGSNFSQVVGTLHQRPGGPRLAGGSPASADIRGEGTASYGRYIFASQGNQKLFVGGWFLIKPGQGNNVDLLNISDALGNPSPTISISNGQLGGGIRYQSFIPAGQDYKNRWIFLGIAAHLKAGTTADVRFYYKLPGQSMQSWAPIDNGQIGITTMDQSNAGFIAFDSTFKGRLGAPSVYTFAEDDFSDISYPSDLIEPASRLTWYCDPLNGSDLADGTTPGTAWRTAAKINEESLYTGMLPASSFEEGDTLIVNTGGGDLDINGDPLRISTPGLNVRAAAGQEWIRVKSYRSLPPGVWQPTGTPNVFSTTDTQTSIVVWEDDKFMNHPLGASFAAVQSQLSSTPGSFWTNGTTLYVHPFGSTNPMTDGKRYERSYNMPGAAFELNAPNLNIQDIHVGKTCLANGVNNDPIGGYCMGVSQAPGTAVIKHCYLYYGSKHNLGITEGAAGDDLLVEDVQAEQGSPYAGAGGQTLFVSFNGQPADLKIVHRFLRCKAVANSGLIGSTQGVMTSTYPVFYAHNLGTPGEPDQFERFEFTDCDFGSGNIQGGAVRSVLLERTHCGSVYMASMVTALQSEFQGMNVGTSGYSLTERNCIHRISGTLSRNPIAGTVDIQGCTFDASQVTDVQGGVFESSLFTRAGALQFIFQNNLVLMPSAVPLANVFSNLQSADALQMSHNAYSLGASTLVYHFNDGTTTQNRSLSQWQSFGHDAGSFQSTNLNLTDLRPNPGSPLINAGIALGPLEDYTGRLFQLRNDIGAFEAYPTTYAQWLSENLVSASTPLQSSDGLGVSGSDNIHNSNLLKYGLGLNAAEPASGSLPELAQPAEPLDNLQFQVTYSRSRWASDLAYSLLYSSDLTNWVPANVLSEVVLKVDDAKEIIRATILGDDAQRGFVKLLVAGINYGVWQAENFSQAEMAIASLSGPGASYLNDGTSNLMKYALGLNSRDSAYSSFPHVHPLAGSPNSPNFEVTYPRNRWAGDLAFSLLYSPDLITWRPATVLSQVVEAQDNGTETVRATISGDNDGRGFVMLQVSGN